MAAGAAAPSPGPGLRAGLPTSQSPGLQLRTARLLLRPWRLGDHAPFAALNADAEVMRHFPAPLDATQSDALARRAQGLIAERGWGLWALEPLAAAGTVPPGFAGFVGLSWVPFELPLPGFEGPQLEIGWRLARASWGQGLASEAAALALGFAHQVLGVARVVSFTAHSNARSMAVMRRIGLQPAGHFDHPRLPAGHPLRPHLLFASRPG